MVTRGEVTSHVIDYKSQSEAVPKSDTIFHGGANISTYSVVEETSIMVLDESKAAAWLDTEGAIIARDRAARVKIVQKEIGSQEANCSFVSRRLGLQCIVRRRTAVKTDDIITWEYEADHIATLPILDIVEPHVETRKKMVQIARARSLYAEKGFRRLFPKRSQALTPREKQRRHGQRNRALHEVNAC